MVCFDFKNKPSLSALIHRFIICITKVFNSGHNFCAAILLFLRKRLKKMLFEEIYNRKKRLIYLLRLLSTKAKWSVVFCGLFTVHLSAIAQQINDNQCSNQPGIVSGLLDVNILFGCAPLKVNVKNAQTGALKSRYIYDYKGGNPNLQPYTPDTATSFTYTKPGIYVLMQLSEDVAGKAQRACRTITVQDAAPPAFKVVPCANGKVILTITNQSTTQYEEYIINWGDGNVAIINRLNLTAPHQYTDLSPKQISVEGRHSVSKCGGKSARTIQLETTGRPGTLTKLEIIDASTAELTIGNPNFFDLELYRQDGSGQFLTTGKVFRADEEKVKVLIDTSKIFCYKLRPRDSCIAALESNVLCVSFLKIIPDIEQNTVLVTPYRYPTDVTKITVDKNNAPWWNPGFTDLFRADNQAECSKQSCYRLRLDTRNGTVLSNIVCADAPPALCASIANVYVPDVFTPNGDGINELFEVKGDPDSKIEVLIYDRWGTPIFHNSLNVLHWNGQINGQAAPIGPYFYRILIIDKIGRKFIKRGTVSLLR